MSSSPYLNWIWFFYYLVLVTLVAWSAVLFFQRRSAATCGMLIGAAVFGITCLIASALMWLGPLLGFPMAFDMQIAYNLWAISAVGMLCFQTCLWFFLRRGDDGSIRIAELEAQIRESFEPGP